MPNCYDCNEPTDGIMTVSKWSVEGNLVQVPACENHFVCIECGRVMEVNPINGHIECFTHGIKNPIIGIDIPNNKESK